VVSHVDLSVLVPTHGRPDLLGRLLSSLAAATPSALRWELVVIQNATPPALEPAYRTALDGAPLPHRVLREPVAGKCRALNRGIEAARGETVAFLDDDVIVRPAYFLGIEEALATTPYRVFGGRVLPLWPAPPPRWLAGAGELSASRGPVVVHDYGDTPRPYAPPMRRPVGCNFFCQRDLFRRHGGFDVRLGPGAGKGHMGGEESELLARFRRGGEAIFYAPRVAVDHPVDPERMTKTYFRYRMFCSGRSAPYLAPRTYPTLFGAPRHIYLKIALTLLRSAAALARRDRIAAFDHRMNLYRYLGAVYEYRRLRRCPAAATGAARVGE
jgi:glycosyltransferase involved in cell wall biosynthesis